MLEGAAVLAGADVLVGAAVVVDLGTVVVVDDVGDGPGTEVLVVVVGKPGMPPVSSTNTWSRQRPLPFPGGAVPKRCVNSTANESRPISLGWIKSSTSRLGSAAVAAAQSTMLTLA